VKPGRFRQIRIGVLLAILLVVAADAWQTRRRVLRWTEPLELTIFPIVAEPDPEVEAYVSSLDGEAFAELEPFFLREAERYQLPLSPVIIAALGPTLSAHPPEPPAEAGVLGAVWFSLKLRYFAFRALSDAPKTRGVRLFVLYHRASAGRSLPHSYGLPEGLIGVVHAFANAEAQGSNQVVIAHEALHTARATDKYGPSGLPAFPEGYAEPERDPRWPQAAAEIMAGRIPLSASDARMPSHLSECVIGPRTAEEIRWTKGSAGGE